MRLDAISLGSNPPHDVNVVIEVPIGGEPIKYEMDKASGALVVDRFLYTPMRYPGNYGFIPGAIMSVKPIGVLVMEDNAGEDEKIIAVPSASLTARYAGVEEVSDLPDITVKQIEHFFAHYKDLEPGKWVKIIRWGDKAEAHRLIREGIERAAAKA